MIHCLSEVQVYLAILCPNLAVLPGLPHTTSFLLLHWYLFSWYGLFIPWPLLQILPLSPFHLQLVSWHHPWQGCVVAFQNYVSVSNLTMQSRLYTQLRGISKMENLIQNSQFPSSVSLSLPSHKMHPAKQHRRKGLRYRRHENTILWIFYMSILFGLFPD